jgi:hypothetical protein
VRTKLQEGQPASPRKPPGCDGANVSTATAGQKKEPRRLTLPGLSEIYNLKL